MSVELDRKNRERFDELIEEAEALLTELDEYDREHELRFTEWVVKTSGLLERLFHNSQQGEKYVGIVERDHGPGFYFGDGQDKVLLATSVQSTLATLKGIRNNYVNGFYDDLSQQIVANVSADYMEQAEALLGEGIEGQFDHVPAAVLCGAVLENRLRQFCEQQDPPIETRKQNGDPKTLGPLIGELERRKLFDRLIFKNLKAWADIRNSAAHGKFDEFARHDVEMMLSGVQHFLSTRL